jgi:dTDP-4-dehydrorhamnose reductase
VPHLVATALDLLIDGETGLWHLTNQEPLSWAAFAVRIARSLGLDDGLVKAVPHRSLGWPAARPANAALMTRRGAALPPLTAAIAHFADCKHQR